MDLQIKRLDHHGIVAGVIDDLGLVEILDEHLPQDDKQEITPGEAVKGMIMNGLGFSHRPLCLSPQFFTNLPMGHLFREGVEAGHFNRHKLGRTLDQCFNFGTESLFALVSRKAVQAESVDLTFQSLDTTSFSLTGSYPEAEGTEDSDSVPIRVTHGYSKDHRPDLKQVVQELLVSQDGGIPLACKAWDGNASDNVVFQERAQALVTSFKSSTEPRYCVADSKLYHAKNAEFLADIIFITRVPGVVKLEAEHITKAMEEDVWIQLDDTYKYTALSVKHMDIQQRWLVVYSKHARTRAQKTIERQTEKVRKNLEKALFHLQAKRFNCESDARSALSAIEKTLKYHVLEDIKCIAHKQHSGRGRPKQGAEATCTQWQITAKIEIDAASISARLDQKSCFILATNAAADEIDNAQVIHRYKAQSSVESGFRFLKDPLFFVSSLFIKKPSRIDALIMVMTMSLLVYSIAQRRLRATMAEVEASIPNQINQPTVTPTLRWVFQCFEGVNLIAVTHTSGERQLYVDGLTELRARIIRYLSGHVGRLYKIQKTSPPV